MRIEISRETEARLADEARRLGILVEALLKRLINEQAPTARSAQPRPELPVWRLGSASRFHRRDIYDHAR
jgi:hypothetical protein